jgi:ribosomal protein S18 acetylase RimI-like enzyme
MAAMHVFTDRAGEQQIERGIRPFDIGRDLRPVARLIAHAFADELDEQGESALRELRILGHMSGLIRLLTRTTSDFNDVFNGFVWIEDGRLVGNVTVQRANNSSGRWQIANVAVDPRYRGRGISRALMETALDYVDEMGGTWGVLQVRANNTVARGLYERMGFEGLGGTTEMYIERSPRRIESPVVSNLTPFSAAESQQIYELVTSQQSGESQWWRAVRAADFDLTLEQRLGEWFNVLLGRERIYRMAIREYENRIEGALVLTARRWHGCHDLKIWTRPNTPDAYQQDLVRWAVTKLSQYPIWPARVSLNLAQKAARETLEAYGFTERLTLITMRRRIRG